MSNAKIAIAAYFIAAAFIMAVAFNPPSRPPPIAASMPAAAPVADLK